MTTASPPTVLSISVEQRTYPPYDPFHGTNAAMLWRRVTITTPEGVAVFEQTDYGHPGRLNPWEPRGVAVALAPKTDRLRALAAAAAAVLD
jgi:hypothetical protein